MQEDFYPEILTVSDLTKEIKTSLEEKFSRVSVIGEISNFKAHISGHWYFVLKDSGAVINCSMWKGFNQHVFFTPEDGMKIIVNGKLSVYAPRGTYQVDVRSMKPAGVGELQEAFERLKKKLDAEGLFDEEFKKPIPSFPKRIGVVTAIDGAAFKDMLSVAERRFPLTEIVIVPARVQGIGSSKSVANGIKLLNRQKDIDVIIVGRGGGSIEDLWAFNEEIVARAIFNSKIPFISGVGHESDFTIADYVADLRAPTPSVAMELATPNVEDIVAFLSNFINNFTDSVTEKIEHNKEEVERILYSYGFKQLPDMVNRKSQQTDNALSSIFSKIEKIFLLLDRKLSVISKILDSHDITRTLKKGFVLVQQNSKFVLRAAKFNKLAAAKLKFSDGDVDINSSGSGSKE